MQDYPRHYCGVFGVFGHPNAAELTYYGLYALQHRGQESAGIVTSDGRQFREYKGMGLVPQVFDGEILHGLIGNMAVGHTRYSTTGSSHLRNAQPLTGNCLRGQLAVAHNGNLTNISELRDELEAKGIMFQTTVDSEVILYLLAQPNVNGHENNLVSVMHRLQGAYSLVIMTEKELIGVRDPYGFRPLCIGKIDDAWVLASETCALDLIHAKFVRDVEPGEIVVITKEGLTSTQAFPGQEPLRLLLSQPGGAFDPVGEGNRASRPCQTNRLGHKPRLVDNVAPRVFSPGEIEAPAHEARVADVGQREGDPLGEPLRGTAAAPGCESPWCRKAVPRPASTMTSSSRKSFRRTSISNTRVLATWNGTMPRNPRPRLPAV